MTESPSSFFWYELMTTDAKAARDFYAEVVGWGLQPHEGSGMDYTVVKAGDTGVGGIMELSPEACEQGARPGWMGYIHARDTDAATDSVKAAGGTVLREPDDIPTVGRFSVVTDPHGAAFMLMTPLDEGQPVTSMTPGNIGWHELYAGDLETDFAFYARQFGWTKGDTMNTDEGFVYQLFNVNGQMTGGMMTRPQEIPVPMWLFYFIVGDIDAAAKRVTDGGGQVLNGPMEVPDGWVLQCMDPQGAMFALAGTRER